jgi:hypothetical protein
MALLTYLNLPSDWKGWPQMADVLVKAMGQKGGKDKLQLETDKIEGLEKQAADLIKEKKALEACSVLIH